MSCACATICQAWVEDKVHRLMNQVIDKNMVDRDEYLATAEVDHCCVHMLTGLWHAPSAGEPTGCSTIGSSEAAMPGGLGHETPVEARQMPNPCSRSGLDALVRGCRD